MSVDASLRYIRKLPKPIPIVGLHSLENQQRIVTNSTSKSFNMLAFILHFAYSSATPQLIRSDECTKKPSVFWYLQPYAVSGKQHRNRLYLRVISREFLSPTANHGR